MKRYKKKYNNLFDSIFMTILGALYSLMMFYFECLSLIEIEDNINKILASLIIIPFLGVGIIGVPFAIFKYGFEKWWIEDDAICSKKLFRNQIKIQFNDIVSIDESTVDALIIDSCISDAIIIKSEKDTIIILKTKYVEKNKILEKIKEKAQF